MQLHLRKCRPDQSTIGTLVRQSSKQRLLRAVRVPERVAPLPDPDTLEAASLRWIIETVDGPAHDDRPRESRNIARGEGNDTLIRPDDAAT